MYGNWLKKNQRGIQKVILGLFLTKVNIMISKKNLKPIMLLLLKYPSSSMRELGVGWKNRFIKPMISGTNITPSTTPLLDPGATIKPSFV